MQREIIDSVLAGHDTLGLLPTGAGKSVTFQVPGLALGGITLVVTPLVALMKDQVDNLRQKGVKAAYLHSGMTYAETNHVWRALATGHCSFLYVAPERLLSRRFMDEIRTLRDIRLVVADEAHCISQWGYDFRPAYLGIASLRKILPATVPFLALTASATPAVADDICRVLQFRDRMDFSTSFARPNISYVVRRTEEKLRQTAHILSKVTGTAIVYVRSRTLTVEIAEELRRYGISAAPFHAGLDFEIKESRIEEWKRGECRVMVATNAFGMGIDKPDVRTVIHWDLPPSIEEYYQEAGRAGRDGMQSYAVLLVDRLATARMKRRLTEAFPENKVLLRVYERVCNFLGIALEEGYDRIYPFDIDKFCTTFKMQRLQVENSLSLLSIGGYMSYIDDKSGAARIRITCTREELYGVADPDGRTESVLRAILRNCPGVFADYVSCPERKIAQETGLTPEQLYEALNALRARGVAAYVPRRSTPLIYLPTSREETRHMLLPETAYRQRKEAMRQRMQAVIDFATGEYGCRAARILRYFGEKSPEPCGTCDICRQKANPLDAERRRDIRHRACELLDTRDTGISAREVMNLFHPYGRMALEVLDTLTDQGAAQAWDDPTRGRVFSRIYS